MKQNDPVEIIPCANGFVVFPMRGLHECTPMSEKMVFQSYAELSRWLSQHFTHRCELITADQPDKPAKKSR
jgi:hypothetical protein